MKQLRVTPTEILRVKEPVYEKLKLEGKSRGDLLRAISENPVLLQRPIVVRDEDVRREIIHAMVFHRQIERLRIEVRGLDR